MSDLFDVVWWEVDSNNILLGTFATETEARTFAKTLQPDDDRWSSTSGVAVTEHPKPAKEIGPSAKWMVSKTWIGQMNEWHCMMFIIQPTGPESHSIESDDFTAEVYAPNEATAIARFEELTGVKFGAS